MSGLLDSLSLAARSLDAQRMGLDVAGQNLANLNTEGYTRRRLELAELAATDRSNAGRGVEVIGVRALRDQYVEGRLRQEQQGTSRDAAIAESLGVVESAFGLPGQSVDAAMTSFFDSFAALAIDATSSEARDGVLVQGQLVASSFNQMSDRLVSAGREADNAVRSGVDELNALSSRIGLLNSKIATATGAEVESLRDQRAVALSSLAELANVTVTSRSDGMVDVSLGQGNPLVMGSTAYPLGITTSSISGMASILSQGTDITAEITGGRIGGLLEVRDQRIPSYITRLDDLAYQMATEVNTRHQAGFDANGAQGLTFFNIPATSAGAAAMIAVNPTVAADSKLVAASSTGAAGDNQTAQAIAGLRDARVLNGGTATPSDLWAELVYRVGADVSTARASHDSRQLVVDQLQRVRDSVSGVSVDEEAAMLMKFQRA